MFTAPDDSLAKTSDARIKLLTLQPFFAVAIDTGPATAHTALSQPWQKLRMRLDIRYKTYT
jgi:hypothetical protein